MLGLASTGIRNQLGLSFIEVANGLDMRVCLVLRRCRWADPPGAASFGEDEASVRGICRLDEGAVHRVCEGERQVWQGGIRPYRGGGWEGRERCELLDPKPVMLLCFRASLTGSVCSVPGQCSAAILELGRVVVEGN